MWGEDILGRLVRDDSNDFIDNVFHNIQMALEEGN
jgi:hypothetical protein